MNMAHVTVMLALVALAWITAGADAQTTCVPGPGGSISCYGGTSPYFPSPPPIVPPVGYGTVSPAPWAPLSPRTTTCVPGPGGSVTCY